MILPLDTQVFTPDGFKESWELFTGDHILNKDNEPVEIMNTNEQEEPVSLLTLEDNSEVKVATRWLESESLEVGTECILPAPIRFLSVEETGYNIALTKRSEGVEYGNFGRYQFIPHHYLTKDVQNRQVFFEGLLFSQSLERHTDDGRVFFIVKNAGLAEDILYLVRSLGGTGGYNYFYNEAEFYEVEVQLPPVFEEGQPTRKIEKVEELGVEDTIEFEVAAPGVILQDFIYIKESREDD